MKGRGTRVLTPTDLQSVSGAEARAKTHFVIVDAAMNDLVRPALYEAWHDVLPVREGGAHFSFPHQQKYSDARPNNASLDEHRERGSRQTRQMRL